MDLEGAATSADVDKGLMGNIWRQNIIHIDLFYILFSSSIGQLVPK